MTVQYIRNKISKRWLIPVSFSLLTTVLYGCGNADEVAGENAQGFTAPSDQTISGNRALQGKLPKDNDSDYESAMRGFIGTLQGPKALINNAQGQPVWNLDEYGFIGEEVPSSANPSLWRQASLNNIHGLFKVTERIYQVRGFDLANMTIIQGRTGWIIVDPLTAEETAAAPKEKKEKAPEPERERKPLQHDEPTSDEWAAGGLGRPAGALETKEWGETIFSAPK